MTKLTFQHVSGPGASLPEEFQQALLPQLVRVLLTEELVDAVTDTEDTVLHVGELEDSAGHQETGVDLVRPLPHLLG